MNTQQHPSRLRRSVVAASALSTAALLIFAAPVAAIAHDGGENSGPISTPDLYSVVEGSTLTVSAPGVLANDSDPDADAISLFDWTVPPGGSFVASADGSFSFTPDFLGTATRTFTYWPQDEHGFKGDPTTVTIEVSDDGLPTPVAVNDAYAVANDQAFSVDAAGGVRGNDSVLPAGGYQLAVTGNPAHGQLTLNPQTGAFDYTPDAGFLGWDGFYYVIDATNPSIPSSTDAFVELHVAVPAPAGGADEYTVEKGAKLTLAAPGVLANDSSSNGHPIRAVSTGGMSHGSNGGVLADGSIDYQTANNFVGVETWYYKIEQLGPNNVVESSSGNIAVTINIVEPGDPGAPVAAADSYTVQKDTLFSLAAPGVLANDSNLVGTYKTTGLTTPAHGLLSLFSDGTMTYKPVAGYVGVDSFEYRVDRVNGNVILASSQAITVTFTVVEPVVDPTDPTDPADPADPPQNVAPVAGDDSYTTPTGVQLEVFAPGVLGNDSDPDGDAITFHLVSGAQHGTFQHLGNGWFRYISDAGFVGVDTVTYQAEEVAGDEKDSNLATISIDVTGEQLETEATTEDGGNGGSTPAAGTPSTLAQTGSESSWIVLLSFLLIYAGGMALRFARKPAVEHDANGEH